MIIKRNKIKVGMVSLGCSKNQYDAEMMLYVIREKGWYIEPDPDKADVVIINTCGFIEPAKQESINTILEFCEKKKLGQIKVVAVTGCLAERYREELAFEIPEADVVLGIGSNKDLIDAIKRALMGERVCRYDSKYDLALEGDRILINAQHFAYVKISEGCDTRCSYCAIPGIRGRQRSRTIENIVSECKKLAAIGVKELDIVAQDTGRYGMDIYGGKCMLPQLLTEICKIDGIEWIRVMYCYPERVTDELLDVMAREDKIVKYLDMPVQHGSKKVLREMYRPGSRQQFMELVEKMRERVPGIAIRTTAIAGFPGETEEDFAELCQLVTDARFERLGCFAYSQEEGTPAGEREDQLPEEVKVRRAELVMDIQMEIAFQIAKSWVGKTLRVMVDTFEDGEYAARSYMDAPDIDTRVYFKSENEYKPGDFVNVEITESRDYDLVGKVI